MVIRSHWIRRCTMPSIALYIFLALTFTKAPVPQAKAEDQETRCVLCLGSRPEEKNLPQAVPICNV